MLHRVLRLAATGLLLPLAACSLVGTESTAGISSGSASATSEAAAGSSTTESPQSSSSAVTTEPPVLNPIAIYAQAVEQEINSDVAVPGSAAQIYLSYLSKMRDMLGKSDGRVSEASETGFVFDVAEGPNIIYDQFSIGDLGIEDLSIDGAVLSDRIAVMSVPLEHSSGLIFEDAISYVTARGERIVVVTVRNGTELDLTPAVWDASFVEINGRQLSSPPEVLPGPSEIIAGATADVAYLFPGGDESPEGAVRQVFLELDSEGYHISEIEADIPLGATQPTFFSFDGGLLRGQIAADVAFETGSSDLSEEALVILRKAALEVKVLKSSSQLCVAGYADSVGDAEVNLQLSQSRAEAVATQLRTYGVSGDIDPVGYGETLSVEDEAPDPNARRVDLIVAGCP